MAELIYIVLWIKKSILQQVIRVSASALSRTLPRLLAKMQKPVVNIPGVKAPKKAAGKKKVVQKVKKTTGNEYHTTHNTYDTLIPADYQNCTKASFVICHNVIPKRTNTTLRNWSVLVVFCLSTMGSC